jgi:hypothetical protein
MCCHVAVGRLLSLAFVTPTPIAIVIVTMDDDVAVTLALFGAVAVGPAPAPGQGPSAARPVCRSMPYVRAMRIRIRERYTKLRDSVGVRR